MRLKLLPKTLLLILPALFLILLGILGYVTWQARSGVAKDAEIKLNLAAKLAACEIGSKLDFALVSAQTLTRIIEGIDGKAHGSRTNVRNILYKFLDETPEILCCWVVFEPNQFDGRDAEFINRDGYSEKGRFQITFARKNGQIVRTFDSTEEVLNDETASSWYLEPFNSTNGCFIEPNTYTYTGLKTDSYFITGVGLPIIINGKKVGVVGLDVDLKDIQKIASSISFSKNDYATLISNTGIIVYHPNPALIGINFNDIDNAFIKNKERISDIVRKGGSTSFKMFDHMLLKEEVFRVIVPVRIGAEPWSIMITAPASSINNAANVLSRNILIASVLGIILITALITLQVNQIILPFQGIRGILNNMSELDFRKNTEFKWVEQYQGDEIADIIQLLNKTRAQICDFAHIITEESKRLSESSKQLSYISYDGAEMIREITDTIQEINARSQLNSAALQEGTAVVQEGASGTAMAAQAAAAGAEAAAELSCFSTEVVFQLKDTASGISSVKELTIETMSAIEEMKVSVESTTSFIDTIEMIVEQAKGLAIKTATLAADAGEHGVTLLSVAADIQKLAAESNDSSAKLRTISHELRRNMGSSTSRMREISLLTEGLSNSSSNAMDNLKKVLSDIEHVSESIRNIAAAAEEVAATDSEVSFSIDRIAKGTADLAGRIQIISENIDISSISVSQVAVESKEIEESSHRLHTMIASFKVDDSWERNKEEKLTEQSEETES